MATSKRRIKYQEAESKIILPFFLFGLVSFIIIVAGSLMALGLSVARLVFF